MEKAIQFSNYEKSLIWNRFIKPVNGTQEEAEHFLEVCENFGLNPLLGDIVFQRYETKRGAKTQFITTRDGLLRVATRQSGMLARPMPMW
ncbi:recombinase RecT [Virgibacillus sediminis]|uniref:Recombinase RecT n=1 Tax=Virgibacillus sediminis TaxID=202260 RepID=A0ABV7A177_9BACI